MPHLMQYSDDEIILLAVNGMRLDIQGAMEVKR